MTLLILEDRANLLDLAYKDINFLHLVGQLGLGQYTARNTDRSTETGCSAGPSLHQNTAPETAGSARALPLPVIAPTAFVQYCPPAQSAV